MEVIKVQCEVKGYEKSKDMPPMYVTSNNDNPKYIIIDVCGNKITVDATDLTEAINNVMNTNRYG